MAGEKRLRPRRAQAICPSHELRSRSSRRGQQRGSVFGSLHRHLPRCREGRQSVCRAAPEPRLKKFRHLTNTRESTLRRRLAQINRIKEGGVLMLIVLAFC
jgi:hypothetical protein